ncbi:ATP-dependent RNA helicase ddx25 [Cichlidogyrus casuarinus]|uniref:RNA helicase n=1 Tax=Cichlidogyrus casuarinus TaxID=1844966 RepID=A0ABD2QFT4_9PLAT
MSMFKGDDSNALQEYLSKLVQIRNTEPSAYVTDYPRPITKQYDAEDLDEVSRADKSYIDKLFKTELVETREEDIELLRADPTNPLHSAKNFKELNLNDDVLKGIYEMRFRKPSGIQEKALPYLLSPNPVNIIAQSQSGTGKTATFLLTMINKVDPSIHFCQAICLSPTRELASQIATVGSQMAKYVNGITFGLAIKESDSLSLDRHGFVTNQIVVATPGTLYRMFKESGTREMINPDQVKVFVFDEADVLLDQDGFYDISMRIKQKLNSQCQILLFSATFDDDLSEFSREIVHNPMVIRVKRNQLTLDNIKQYYRPLPDLASKYRFLIEIYKNFTVGQAIVFCSTRNEAHWLQDQLEADGHSVGVLTAALDVPSRENIINRFRDSFERVLIATNVMNNHCSGLDIPQVNLIVNWNMPRDRRFRADCETYLHRIGRSGRFGKKGLAINFVTPEEKSILTEIENHFGMYPTLTHTNAL